MARYLKRQRSLTRVALERLAEEALPEEEMQDSAGDEEEQKVERPLGLHEQRMGTVLSVLRGAGAKSVLDLGCGEGKLLRHLLGDQQFEKILGMDVSWRSIEIAAERLKLGQLPERQRARIELVQGSLMYRDKRLTGFDAAAIVEVIEHLDAARLAAFERVLFEFAKPSLIVITTPNAEYNALFPTLPAGHFRHRDHRFEWSRREFSTWAERLASAFGYKLRVQPVGPEDPVTEHRRRWGSSNLWRLAREHPDPGTLSGCPYRPLRLRQIQFWPQAFSADRSRFVRRMPWTRLRQRKRPVCNQRSVRFAAYDRAQAACARKADSH